MNYFQAFKKMSNIHWVDVAILLFFAYSDLMQKTHTNWNMGSSLFLVVLWLAVSEWGLRLFVANLIDPPFYHDPDNITVDTIYGYVARTPLLAALLVVPIMHGNLLIQIFAVSLLIAGYYVFCRAWDVLEVYKALEKKKKTSIDA